MNKPGITKYIFTFLIAFACYLNFYGQTNDPFREINGMFDSLKTIQNDSLKLSFNQNIISKLQAVLTNRSSFNYNTDSLKRMGMVEAPDKKFRIYTWNVPLQNGTHAYFGIIQLKPEKGQNCILYSLNDVSKNIKEGITGQSFMAPSWFGALYYQIIETKVKKTTVYTVMATRFNDLFTTQKLIETLYFNDNNIPVFGYPILEYGLKLEKRILFEFSINVRMSLRYNEETEMIVFDHLAPSSPVHSGNYKFYGPDFSYDAYKFDNSKDRWIYMPNITIRNEKRKKAIHPIIPPPERLNNIDSSKTR